MKSAAHRKKDRDERQSARETAVTDAEVDEYVHFRRRLSDAIDMYFGGSISAFGRAAGTDYHGAQAWITESSRKKKPSFESVQAIVRAFKGAGMSPAELVELLGSAAGEPPYPAWRELLEMHGLDLQPDEVAHLRIYPWGRKEPNVSAYLQILAIYRTLPEWQG
jgi:hypothetical protein